MSERLTKKKLLSATATVVMAGAALTACTSGEQPKPSSTVTSESPEATLARQNREAFLDQFNHIPAPVEVIAQPLVITDEARQRDEALDGIGSDSIQPDDYDYREEIASALRAVRNTTNPDVKADARRHLDQELAKGAVEAVAYHTYTFDNSSRIIHDNTALVDDARDQLTLISDATLRKRAADLVDRTLVDQAVTDRDGKLSKAEAALLALAPDSLKELGKEMVTNDSTYEVFEKKLREDTGDLDGENSGFSDLYDGSADTAKYVNDTLKKYSADRGAHQGDPNRPGVKDIALGQLTFTTPDEARIAKDNLLAMPDQYQAIQGEALRAFDGKILDELDDLLTEPTVATTEETQALVDTAREYAGLVMGEKAKKLASALVAVRLAQLYVELGDSAVSDDEDAAARDQLLLSQLPDGSKAKKVALKIRGGAHDSYILEDMVDATSSEAFEVYYSADQKLTNGSNPQAKNSINDTARDYLAANG